MNAPLKIGITGGIGSGKSVIARCVEIFGFPVFNADQESKQILANDPSVVSKVKQLLGPSSYHADDTPNRPFISQEVFGNPDKLAALNQILHPAVRQAFHNWVLFHKNSKLVFKEAAILFESGAFREVDRVIAVTAPDLIRIKRVMMRDGRNETETLKIISHQMTQQELISRSDFNIVNDEHTADLPQLKEVIHALLKEAS